MSVEVVRDRFTAALEVHHRPSPSGSGHVARLDRGQRITCEAFADLTVRVDDILG
jgi:hypothetical protein